MSKEAVIALILSSRKSANDDQTAYAFVRTNSPRYVAITNRGHIETDRVDFAASAAWFGEFPILDRASGLTV